MDTPTVVALVTAIISGGLGGIATLLAYAHGYLRIEKLESKRRRLEVAYDVLAYRYVLQAGSNSDDASRHGFNRALNQVPVVFGDDAEIIQAFDAFSNNKSDENLKRLLVVLTRRTGLRGIVLDSHLMKTLSI
ncbi:hypothetical protein E2F50_05040 [Rhizobium deserti]|uniref:Uncharacterized protein n=1 Tax=Rhizobium deserti TaxID=2547961 RepID=A0A4R5UNL6_9HYPH|nr:hypothetical protein [Rhizobium deserti]TDK39481.1 hypothetical protein E2F50_05040 [Rhizobium deserti]